MSIKSVCSESKPMTYEYQLISAAVRCQVHNCTTAKAQWIPLLENVADLAPNGLCLALCGEKESTSAVELPFPDWFHWKPRLPSDCMLCFLYFSTHCHPTGMISWMLLTVIPGIPPCQGETFYIVKLWMSCLTLATHEALHSSLDQVLFCFL